jgi:hypothetical protein
MFISYLHSNAELTGPICLQSLCNNGRSPGTKTENGEVPASEFERFVGLLTLKEH